MFTNFCYWTSAVIVLTPTIAVTQDSFLVKPNAKWNYHAKGEAPARNWQAIDFNANDWPQGTAGFGYGDGDDATELPNMRGRFTTVQIRTDFVIDDSAKTNDLYLYVSYDDGFVAWINGSEVARVNVAESNGGLAAGNHEAEGSERFVLRNAGSLLKVGRNVLAVEGCNRSADSSDFSLHPTLSNHPDANLQSIPISRARAIADINELERRIDDQSSYVQRNRFDRKRAFDELRKSITNEVSVFVLHEKLQRLIARIGDCHAGAYLSESDDRAAYLPFTLADTSNGVAALKVDRSALVDMDCPYVSAIDGIPLDQWLDVAATYVANGSPQLIRNRSLGAVRRIDQMRRHLNLPASPVATITLQSANSSQSRKHKVTLTQRRSPVGRVPIARTRLLDGNIGYLRIEKMDNRLEKTISRHMQDFRTTDGLIIDVRDNGGGRYGILRLMYGYLTPPDEKPYVTNIAAYRESKLFGTDHIHYRPTFREGYKGWNDKQLAAISSARENFSPEWTPPVDLFSDWHYMVLEKTPDVSQYHYKKNVVVLCNAGAFSATDGFLSGMADIPGVTLLGEPSGGGSGATRRFVLPASGIRIALSSMASFRPNGKLFDGNGVEVDIKMKPTVNDFLGKSDTVRTKAIELIMSQSN